MNPYFDKFELFSKDRMRESIPYSECLSITPDKLRETRAETKATTVPDFKISKKEDGNGEVS